MFVAGDRRFNGVAGMVTLHESLRTPTSGVESTAGGYVGHLFTGFRAADELMVWEPDAATS